MIEVLPSGKHQIYVINDVHESECSQACQELTNLIEHVESLHREVMWILPHRNSWVLVTR